MDKSFRVHTNISSDTVLNVNMKQDFDFLEVLSLKLRQKDAYRLHSSNYGVIVGRVLANEAFGIPNAKVSVFIEKESDDTTDMESIYPYYEVTSKDKEGRRYNLLPDESDDKCYKVVGTFPSKRLVLDDNVQLEIYDKYWKYTTVTNNSGDYMLYGVPTGTLTIHVDLDLSDIGVLSQKPRDFEYKGYNITMFDSPNQFKDGTNLDGLAQLFAQNKSVYVYPFWGDSDNGTAAITRSDIEIQYKFEPTCVFMGSIVSDNEGHAIGHKCSPDIENGINSQLIGGNGTIEMIRKTTDGLVEEFQIQGNQLIDENGVWCYQIPMNLDYIGTDEYGNIVPTDNPSKGIPTRTQVRFRISKTETNSEGFSRHTAKYLVPMNPMFSEDSNQPKIDYNGSEIEKMYSFGSSTPLSCFRDLYWNNVYSVKNYIPKTQVAHRAYAKNYCALKGSNLADDQNPIPFNKLNINLPFLYMVVCIIYRIMVKVVKMINKIISFLYWLVYKCCIKIFRWKICPFRPLRHLLGDLSCITMSAGGDEGNIAYYPGCSKSAMNDSSCPDDMLGSCRKSNDDKKLMDAIQRNLALEFKIVRLDLYQDWINGCLYMPLWYWKKRKKRKFLGITIMRAKNQFCSDESFYSRLKSIVTCNIGYTDTNLSVSNNKSSMPDSEKRWHKNKSGSVRYYRGLIKPVENNDGLTVYYYSALQATTDNDNPKLEMVRRPKNFNAVRLFATDIILLGNLDPHNIYGIPQFFECLPSTTANVPPIATIEEDTSDGENSSNNSNEGLNGNDEDSGTTVTTGMDWNHDGEKQSPKLKTGLFMDLECTYANTRPKSCINVERMSELGVSLDTTHRVAYSSNGELKYGDIENDGFISKYELDDMENRSMFATMNHIGFIPQEYQDMHDGYETQVRDERTNYLIPKFKYIYPVDFDGRLQLPMSMYRNGFQQSMFDERDQSYVTFRLGAEENNDKIRNNENRIRHFYIQRDGVYSMPLYNNSYYFYFGIKKGSTAIDKFNSMFYAQCFKKTKLPFMMDLDYRGRSYCTSAYTNDLRDDYAYAYIKFSSDNIKAPYSYWLYDSKGKLIIGEDDMEADTFVIGGYIDDYGEVKSNEYGKICYQSDSTKCLTTEDGSGFIYLKNQEYTLEITDTNGKTISQNVKLDTPHITGEYSSRSLGTKFYNTETTKKDYICNDETAFYGEIHMTSFTVDGYECTITSAEAISSGNIIKLRLTGSSPYINPNVGGITANSEIILELRAIDLEEGESTESCMCGGGTPTPQWRLITGDDYTELVFYVYKPKTYVMRMIQTCNGQDVNSSEEIIKIDNGEPFMTYLNRMPVKFMLGTSTDDSGASIANTSEFYRSDHVPTATGNGITGWYGVHTEDTYRFDGTFISNQSLWEDVLNGTTDSIASPTVKQAILVFKFNSMFSLSEGVYVTEDSSKRLEMTSEGGVSPILYRTVAPTYDNDSTIRTQYRFSEESDVYCSDYQSNVVGDNYCPNTAYNPGVANGPVFNNRIYDNTDKLGNYFGAFTRDGSYISKNKIDGINIGIERSPSFASISPYRENGVLKIMGKDVTMAVTGLSRVYDKGTGANQQTLPGDKKRTTQPYLRGLFVDRRLDYDFIIFAPAMGSNFSLYSGIKAVERDRVWRSGRISGWTMNGIEMSYDENDEYNIISSSVASTTVDDETYYPSAIYNTRLEYTFKYNSNHRCLNCNYQGLGLDPRQPCPNCGGEVIPYQGEFGSQRSITDNNITMYSDVYSHTMDGDGPYDDAKTRYNNSSGDGVWNVGTLGYIPGYDLDYMPLVKRFYSSEFCGIDLRNFYWSDGNRSRLGHYCAVQQTRTLSMFDLKKPFYVYCYPANPSYGNGDFDKDNYPTERFIDIGNLPPLTMYHYETESCSYGMQAYPQDDGTIVAQTNEGEKVEFDLNWINPVTMVPPNADSTDYVNIEYGALSSGLNDELIFTAEAGNISFKLNSYTCEGFEVYTTAPRLIQVLPYIQGTNLDGISFVKTYTKTGEIGLSGIENLDMAIDLVTLDGCVLSFPLNNKWAKKMLGLEQTVFCPEGVTVWSGLTSSNGKTVQRINVKGGPLTEGAFFKKDDEWLTSDNEDFTNVLFMKNINALTNDGTSATAFAVLVDREYKSEDDNHLIRHLRTIETSDIYDCRKLRMRMANNSESGGPYSYVVMNISNKHEEELITGISGQTEEGSTDVDIETTKETKNFDTKVFTQVLTFEMLFDTRPSTNVQDRENGTFADYDMMSYVFRFKSKNGEQFDVSPTDVEFDLKGDADTGNPNSSLKLTVIWPSNMGIIIDDQWSGSNIPCELFARTPSNFTYRLSKFKIQLESQDPDGGSTQDKKDAMVENEKYKTNVKLV